ncbi:hypothetical protein JHJ32_01765 [Parapedobacter sp. ISTM3]|uniref:hypothetical protein n=1 Tax=Parapedobacter sp. ISTM3 TaxID=2800130 RepID=UPI001903A90F|nr:hypothetical protein [Parapedobacter sp. ISTM3]MBK1438704.1 hypothetical protein [Parapedobacter sp. ISTM3]
MKAIIFLAMLSLVICLSCNKENVNAGSSDLKLKLITIAGTTAQGDESDDNRVIAVLDIKSYNAKTGEVIFYNKLPNNIGDWQNNRYHVNVYANNDTHLFTLTYSNSFFSHLYNEPVLYYSLLDNSDIPGLTTKKNRWYMLSGYPYGKVIGSETITDDEQWENFQKIESEWNLFIDELKRTGKYIN